MLETLYVKDKKYFDRKCTKKHNCDRERERETHSLTQTQIVAI